MTDNKSVVQNPDIELAGVMSDCNVEQARRVYDPQNIAPTISAGGGTGSIPKVDVTEESSQQGDVAILKPERTEYGKAIRSDYEKGKVNESRHNMTELQRRKDGLANTLTTVPKDNLLVEGKVDFIKWPSATQKGYMEAHEGDGIVMQRPHAARGTVQSQSSPTLTTQVGGGSGVVVTDGVNTTEDDVQSSLTERTDIDSAIDEKMIEVESGRLCIRYLTPRECLRLMGQSEDAIDKIMAAEPSKTRQYKMAGNSIVVDVLVDIFKGIYVDKTFGKCERRPSLEDFL